MGVGVGGCVEVDVVGLDLWLGGGCLRFCCDEEEETDCAEEEESAWLGADMMMER